MWEIRKCSFVFQTRHLMRSAPCKTGILVCSVHLCKTPCTYMFFCSGSQKNLCICQFCFVQTNCVAFPAFTASFIKNSNRSFLGLFVCSKSEEEREREREREILFILLLISSTCQRQHGEDYLVVSRMKGWGQNCNCLWLSGQPSEGSYRIIVCLMFGNSQTLSQEAYFSGFALIKTMISPNHCGASVIVMVHSFQYFGWIALVLHRRGVKVRWIGKIILDFWDCLWSIWRALDHPDSHMPATLILGVAERPCTFLTNVRWNRKRVRKCDGPRKVVPIWSAHAQVYVPRNGLSPAESSTRFISSLLNLCWLKSEVQEWTNVIWKCTCIPPNSFYLPSVRTHNNWSSRENLLSYHFCSRCYRISFYTQLLRSSAH